MIRSVRAAVAVALFAAVLPAQESVDNATIEKIKAEAMQRSTVMETMSWLTDVHGPRLTGSPITKRAGDWAIGALKGYGLANAHFETWGPFGRGWTNERFSFQGIAPQPFQLAAVPRAWSPSTKGNVKGNAILIHVDSFADLQKFAGKLKGKFVMLDTAVDVKAHFTAEGSRLTDEQLATMTWRCRRPRWFPRAVQRHA
jgi:carboxypeptidase Q